MTVTSAVRTAGPYTGTGLVSTYAFAFKVFTSSDVTAQVTGTDGVLTTPTFTVALNPDQTFNPGGTVTLAAGPLAAGAVLELSSVLPLTQTAALTNLGGFYPQVIEGALDKLTILLQQIFGNTASALRVPELGGITTLPAVAQRKLTYLMFDNLGNPTVGVPASGSAGDVLAQLGSPISPLGSKLVAYMRRCAGSVARYVEDALSDQLSVFNFAPLADGTTDETVGLIAAHVEAIAKNCQAYYPRGVHLTTASIPNFHEVQKRGSGAVRRGADTFYIEPTAAQINRIYIDPAVGNDANDGLSASFAVKTLARAGAIIDLYAPYSGGQWIVVGAAGTVRGQFTLAENVRGRSRIKIRGPAVSGGTPTFIIDGAGIDSYGLNFNGNNKVELQDILINNTLDYGWVCQDFCDVLETNVHSTNINAGLGVGKKAQQSRWRQVGGKTTNCVVGWEAINATTFSFSGGALAQNCSQCGLLAQEQSSGHLDNSTVDTCVVGVDLTARSRVHALGSTIQNNVTAAWRAQIGSDFYDNPTTPNTFTGNGNKGLRYSGSIDSNRMNLHTTEMLAPVDQAFVTFTGTLVPTTVKPYPDALFADDFTTSTKRWRIKVVGDVAGTAGTKTLTLNLAGSLVAQAVIPSAATGGFVLEVEVWEAPGSGASQSYTAECRMNGQPLQLFSGSRSITVVTGSDIQADLIATLANVADTVHIRCVTRGVAG